MASLAPPQGLCPPLHPLPLLGCYFDGDKTWRGSGTRWHPVVPPFGLIKCAICTCKVSAGPSPPSVPRSSLVEGLPQHPWVPSAAGHCSRGSNQAEVHEPCSNCPVSPMSPCTPRRAPRVKCTARRCNAHGSPVPTLCASAPPTAASSAQVPAPPLAFCSPGKTHMLPHATISNAMRCPHCGLAAFQCPFLQPLRRVSQSWLTPCRQMGHGRAASGAAGTSTMRAGTPLCPPSER